MDSGALGRSGLAAAQVALGVLPTQHDLVFERFFDEAGGMQLVVHAPFGGRINRALGLALRKRFCRRSTSSSRRRPATTPSCSRSARDSFPLEDVPQFLTPETAEEALAQALLPLADVPGALALEPRPRARGPAAARRPQARPPPIQRMEADDLMAAVFPALAALPGERRRRPIAIPDHPIVRQTMHDCLHEAIDMDGCGVARRARGGADHGPTSVDTTEPSPLRTRS